MQESKGSKHDEKGKALNEKRQKDATSDDTLSDIEATEKSKSTASGANKDNSAPSPDGQFDDSRSRAGNDALTDIGKDEGGAG
jgi:hypothetical protein